MMDDNEFREQYHPLRVPAHFEADASIEDKTLFAIGQLGRATADEVVAKLKELNGGESDKLLIADVHQLLTTWYEKGLLTGEQDGENLYYSLQKITHANDGAVDPDLLAPGLD
jgi:hypothetical protein